MNEKQPMIHPYIALALGIIAGSSATVIFKMGDAPAGAAAGYRLLIAIVLMTPFILWKYSGELKKLRSKEWLFSFLSGLFLAIHFVLLFEALNFTSVASTVLFISMQPLFTFVGAYLFMKERLSFLSICGAFIVITGSVIIFWSDVQVSDMAAFGNVLALLSAMMMSIYLLFGQYLRKTLSSMSYSYVVYCTSALCIFIYLIITREPLIGYSAQNWLTFIALALIPTIMGHSIFNWVVKWVSASIISLSTLFQPITAAILAYFLLREVVSVSQVIGGSVILIGIYIFVKYKK